MKMFNLNGGGGTWLGNLTSLKLTFFREVF